jgi:hypothetical protein
MTQRIVIKNFKVTLSIRYLHNTPHCYSGYLNIKNSKLLDEINRIFLDTLIKM